MATYHCHGATKRAIFRCGHRCWWPFFLPGLAVLRSALGCSVRAPASPGLRLPIFAVFEFDLRSRCVVPRARSTAPPRMTKLREGRSYGQRRQGTAARECSEHAGHDYCVPNLRRRILYQLRSTSGCRDIWVRQDAMSAVRAELSRVRRYRTGGGPAEIKWSRIRGARLRCRVKALVDVFFTSSVAASMNFNAIIVSRRRSDAPRWGPRAWGRQDLAPPVPA